MNYFNLVEILDFFIIIIMSSELFSFFTWGLRDNGIHQEIKDSEKLLNMKIKSCSIEEYNVLQDRIERIKKELESSSPG